mmetsp:Transcript_32336/g.42797  ORF Transcript_32336/g.42797 Transcript_32336/m.42797 type:complete len:84 (-) Transcript_32336:461-712(-)
MVNSMVLASRDYRGSMDPDFESEWNETIDTFDVVFTFVYLFECLGKIIVMGFHGHVNSYIRLNWNKLDFMIVVFSMLTFVPGL